MIDDSAALVRVRVFYQADPGGLIPGGIDTFIQGLIRNAPPDIAFTVVGLTTDPAARPVGRWTRVRLDDAVVPFFPVGTNPDPGGRSAFPLSARVTLGVMRHFRRATSDCDVLDFHRIEPSLAFLADDRPKNAFIHQNMDVIRGDNADIRWSRFPSGYFALEKLAMQRLASVFCVREDAVEAYRSRYPQLAERFRFVPTWMDPATFRPPSAEERSRLRALGKARYGIGADDVLLVSVGRLDRQKNPVLLIESFARIAAARGDLKLVVVGDGVLRASLERLVRSLELEQRVLFVGLKPAREVADLLRASAAFVMTSTYEGMPISVLEALGCGVPVVATNVGEIARVVKPGANGELVDDHQPEAFAAAIGRCLERRDHYSGAACVRAAADFVPERVLAPVYENYRALARARRAATSGSRRRGSMDAAGDGCVAVSSTQPDAAAQRAGEVKMLGVPFSTADPALVLGAMDRAIETRSVGHYISITNTESIYHALRLPEHKAYIEQADFSLCDGVGVIVAGLFWGHRIKRLNGPVLQLEASRYGERRGWRHFYYGGKDGVAEQMAENLRKRHPEMQVVGVYTPPFRPLTREEDEEVIRRIHASGADIVWVGLGLLRQERWIAEHLGRIRVPWMIGVGAAFDYHSGAVPWAPPFLRAVGLEWLFRLILQPRLRAKRYWWSLVFVAEAAAKGSMASLGRILGMRRP